MAHDPSQTLVQTYPIASREDGLAAIASVVITFVGGGPGEVVLDMIVDGLVLVTFSRMIYFGQYNETKFQKTCGVVRIVSLPKLAFADVSSMMEMQAVDYYGAPVPNATVYVVVSGQYIRPRPGTNETVWTVRADSNGSAYFPVRSYGSSGQFGAVFSVYCSLFGNAGALFFRDRVKRLNVTSVNASAVAVSIVPFHWSTISTANPVCLTRVSKWSPAYIPNWYQTNDSIQIANEVCITSPGDNYIVLQCHVFEEAPGIFGTIFRVNENYFGPLTLYSSAGSVGSLELVSSAFVKPFRVGEYLAAQPAVRVLDTNGVPMVNAVAFAQLVMIDSTDGSRTPIDMFLNQSEIHKGTFVRYAPGNATTLALVSAPFSNRADTSGIAQWEQLMCLGITPDTNFSLRYCTAIDVALDINNLTSSVDYCVDDSLIFEQDQSQATTLNISVDSLQGTPGQYLPDIVVNGYYSSSGEGVPVMFCAPFLQDATRQLLVFTEEEGVPYGTFYQIGNALFISNMVKLSQDLPEGTYNLIIVCVGAASQPIPVSVSSTVTALIIAQPPAPAMSFEQITTVSMLALGSSGRPIANAPLKLTIANNDLDCALGLKSPLQCGTLEPGTIDYVKTASNGLGSCVFAFLGAGTGTYTLKVFIPSAQGTDSIQNIAQTSIAAVVGGLGKGFAPCLAFVNEYANSFYTLFSVMNELAVHPTVSSVANSAKTDMLALLGVAPAAAVGLSFQINVTNPVSEIRWISWPPWSFTGTLSTISAITGEKTAEVFTINDCPTVQLVDSHGMPLPNRTINLEIFPPSSGDTVQIVSFGTESNYFSDADGIKVICPIVVSTSSSGVFPIRITSNGGGNLSSFLVFKQPTTLSRTKLMEYLTVGLIVFFSPMLMASVPHSSILYELAGTALSSGLTIFSALSYDNIPDSSYYRGYYVFLVCALGLVSLSSLMLLVVEFASRSRYALRWLNGERKAEKVYQYVLWIVNITSAKQQKQKLKGQSDVNPVRIEDTSPIRTQGQELPLLRGASTYSEPESEEVDQEISKSGSLGKADKLTLRSTSNDELEIRSPGPPTEGGSTRIDLRSSLEKVLIKKKPARRLVKRSLLPSIAYDRPELEPTFLPFGFIIVITFTCVLMVSLAFLLLFLHNQIDYYFHKLLIFLPAASDNSRITLANNQIVNVLCAGIAMVVENFPELGALMNLIPRLRSVNVVVYLGDLRDNLSTVLLGIELLFIVAGSVSIAAVTTALLMTYWKIPRLILHVRRGQLRLPENAHKVTPVEGQIGQHVMLLIILQQLTFWFIVLLGLVFALPVVRGFISDNWLVLGLTFGTSFISQFVAEKVVVERLLSEHNFVVLPELYAVWHFVALILGIFTGIVSGVVRWCTAVVVLTFTFASVELSVMPATFLSLDKAHIGFLCSIQTEAVNGNPIMLVFASILTLTCELRRQAVEQARQTVPKVDVDSLFTADRRMSSAVVNLARLIARASASSANSLKLDVAPAAGSLCIRAYVEDVAWRRRVRVQQRFWLWWILHKNPTLRETRKHALEYVSD